MKKSILLAILFMFICILGAQTTIRETLPNGMEVVVKENQSNNSVGFYCFVKTGSAHEGEYLGMGLSHYLEHVVSGGSTKFNTEAEYQEMETEIGAVVNAYTTYYATAYHILVESEFSDKALSMLAEHVAFCSFAPEEVDREKEVILKEIVMRSTPPASKMYQRSQEILYNYSTRRYPVIGYSELFRQVSREQLMDYYHKRYVPNNMVFVAVGNFDAAETMDKIRTTFADFQRGILEPVYIKPEPVKTADLSYHQEFDINLPRVYMTTILPHHDIQDNYKIDMAMEILFGKRKSRIRYKLVEELKLVNWVSGWMNGSPIENEATISIALEAKDPQKVKEIVNLIDEEIEKAVSEGFSDLEIQNYISRLKAEHILSTPGVDSECNRIGWNMMAWGVPDTYDFDLEQYEKVSSSDMQAALKKHLLPKKRLVYYGMPKNSSSVFETSNNIVVEKTEPEKIEEKDYSIIYQKNNRAPVLRGVITLPISDSYESIEDAGTLSFMSKLMLTGSKKYPSLDLTEWLEDHVAEINVSLHYSGLSISFECLNTDFPQLKEIILDGINNPEFPEKEIKLAKERAMAGFQRSQARATSHHREFLKTTLYNGKKDGLTRKEKLDIISNLTQKDLKEMHEKFIKANNVNFSFVGDVSKEEVLDYAEEIFKKIPHGEINQEKVALEVPDIDQYFTNKYNFEQVNIDLNCIAPSTSSEDFYGMKVIEALLNGGRGRLHFAVRGENDLAYFAGPTYEHTEDYGFFRVTSQTSLEKKDELINVLKNELTKLKEIPVSEDEIRSAVSELSKMYKAMLNDNSFARYYAYYESIGLGYNFLETSHERLVNTSPAEVQRVANKYFKNIAVIVSEPNDQVDLMVK